MIEKTVKKQLLNNIPSYILDQSKIRIEQSVDGITIMTFALNIGVSLGLRNFIELINALHIIGYQQILDLQYPANQEYLMSVIFKFLQADIIHQDWSTSYLFNFEPDLNYVRSSFERNETTFLS